MDRKTRITNQTTAVKERAAPKFWNFTDNGETAELQLFGTIASEDSWWDEDCVTYRNFIDELNGLGEKKSIHVVIQSGGGDVFAANAIYTALIMNRAVITGTVIGICASAATIVLMACSSRKIAKNAILMVHNPSISLFGAYQAEDLLKLAEVTDQVKKSIVTAYMDRLGKSEDEICQMMDEESWYVGQEAVDAGFCDSVIVSDFQDYIFSNKFVVDGTAYSFKNYLENFVPDHVRKKVQGFSNQGNRGQERGVGMSEKDAMIDISDAASLRAAYPRLCAQVESEAVQAERERLKAIDEIAAGIPENVLIKAKYEEPVSAADLALAQMKANSAAGQQFLAGMAADMQESGAAAVQAEPNAGEDDTAKQKAESEKKVSGLAGKLKNDKRRGKQ